MFTIVTIIKTLYFRLLLVVFLFVSAIGNVLAQESHIKPFSQSFINPVQAEVFAYLSGGNNSLSNLWTANNNINTSDFNLLGTRLESGIGAELYKSKFKLLHIGGYLGYKNIMYSYEKDSFNNSGLYSHWLAMDLNVGLSYLGFGVKSDVFLGSKIKNDNHFSYEGLYPDCFNPIALSLYISIYYRFTRLKCEVRFGMNLTPELDPMKLSYYNMSKTYVDGEYLEFKLSYRIFTSGKVHDAPYVL